MKILKEDDYEEMAAAFQCLQIQTLYQRLKDNGIEESRCRKICEQFTLSFGLALDQHWVNSECGNVFPVVGFTKLHADYSPDVLYLNTGMFLFAEYAMGNIAWFFEENQPSENPQKHGIAGEHGMPA